MRLLKKTFASICLILSTQVTFAGSTSDPYEPFNRSMYSLNQGIDKYALKPAATVYQTLLPDFLLKGISNFFSNLGQIPTIGNDLLQAEFYQATGDTWRLLINSTAGILGFFDIASSIGLPRHNQDFGLTLAKWGYQSSNYLVLPLLGPSTVRDAMGLPVDFNILSIYPYIYPSRDRYSLVGLNMVNQRARLLKFDDILQQAAFDEYTFVRNAYLQRRNYKIQKITGDSHSSINNDDNSE